MCLHQRRQLRTMEQRHCQSQSNGCVRGMEGKGEGDPKLGEESVRPECSGGCQDPMWDAEGEGQGVAGILGALRGGGVSHLGK